MTSRQALKCAECGRTLPNDAAGDRCFKCVRKRDKRLPVDFAAEARLIAAGISYMLPDTESARRQVENYVEGRFRFVVERLAVEIAAKDDLIAEARLALRRLYNVTPDYRSTVAAREYAAGVLGTLDAPDTGTQDDQVAAPVVDAIREHLKEGESHVDFIARTIREAKR